MRPAGMMLLLAVGASCGRVHFEGRADLVDGDSGDTPSGPRFTRLVAFGDLTCAEYAGRLYCWGENGSRQLGDGTTTDRGRPTPVAVPQGTLGAFTAGETHACAIVQSKLFCWGQSSATQMLPMPSQILADGVTDVAAGQQFTCFVATGRVWCWGANGTGQLGDTTVTSRDAPAPIVSETTFVAVDAGDDHACALTAANVALCWGHNDDGAMGTGSFAPAMQEVPTPVVSTITTIPRIAGWHACAMRGAEVWCWGRNMEGALGDGTIVPKAAPQPVPLFTASRVETGGGPNDLDATCAITPGSPTAGGGELWCWGAGTGGRLGTGGTDPQLFPIKVGNLPGPVTDVALGYAHTCALLADGDIWCWGRGTSGQLGDGLLQDSLAPVRVLPPP